MWKYSWNKKKYRLFKLSNILLCGQQWLSRELEVKVSMTEAQFHLDQLMEDRKRLTQDLKELRTGLEKGPLTEVSLCKSFNAFAD